MNSFIFPEAILHETAGRQIITDWYRRDETQCIAPLLAAAELPPSVLQQIAATAERLITAVRAQRVGKSGLDSFLHEYNLSSEEGIALMCLAEATLRIPDTPTMDRLIQDKIATADWQAHLGKNDSYFVNAASWALMLTGKILNPEQSGSRYFAPVLQRLSGPVIRKAVKQAMRIMGQQFVMGRTIEEALKQAKTESRQGYRFSYDMLGEAARTAADAQAYFLAYQAAIEAIAQHLPSHNVYENPGISVKLSALHPRYEFAQQQRCLPVLLERVKTLMLAAQAAQINLTIDAEEADRLDLSLDLIDSVLTDPQFRGWDGFGIALQAYQKRSFYVIDWLAEIAKRSQCKLMVRLVKGAYWDYEIKDSQVKGTEGYPVFTRKVNTDLSYLACAGKLIGYGELFYPQFATHNAYTVAAVLAMMGERRDFEFQCLKGMGHALYDEVVPKNKLQIPCRIYAPVGRHEDLLPYLVRRLLENGANTSFVNRIVDEKTPISELTKHPAEEIKRLASIPHPLIPLPEHIFAPQRKNSRGVDLSNKDHLAKLATRMTQASSTWQAIPTFTAPNRSQIPARPHFNPVHYEQIIGTVQEATSEDLEFALQQASGAQFAWDRQGVAARAQYLLKLADLLEANQAELLTIIVREGGKAVPDALSEVREAVDYCRYYATLGVEILSPKPMPGPTGESNILQMHGRGVFLCISPWNFPLAIFTGQVVAALVAGNCVIAKPAQQTPLIAANAVSLMHEAGIPPSVVQLLPGKGSTIGAAAVNDERIGGIMFTGSTETARGINIALANRAGPIIPFIAETGGQNALIADSTALPEQLVSDVITSAFNSAGQRCSALRVLFLQDEIAEKVIIMLKGAMAELQIGDPAWLATDIGPLIDESSKRKLQSHAERMTKEGRLIYEVSLHPGSQHGSFFAPRAYEIPSLHLLTEEVFGPILHVIRYRSQDLDQVIADIHATGYGLTLGIHSRINSTVEYIVQRMQVGNMYVNRNMIGAVVGVQPFGGEGLSGTGPKAGGPHYLPRLCHERTVSENTAATGGNTSLMTLSE